MIGTQIGSYKIEEEIGEGGMGAVYRALDTRTDEIVAVKALKESILKHSPEVLDRFVREGEALRQLNHPNIITMREAFEHEGRHYLVMNFIEGGDLRGVLEKEKQLSLTRGLQIALDLADALTRAHRLDIIHRDIKPENVLLADDGIPRLTDFGVARVGANDNITQEGEMMGTISYLSPEGCKGIALDERADIWAFGVLLFEMLAGEKPFPGDNIVTVINSIMQEEPQDIQSLRKDLPEELIDLIYRMLVKDPEGRIPSIRMVGAELEAILKGRSFTPTPAPSRTTLPSADRAVFNTPTPTPSAGRHNLHTPATPFVGRKNELKELKGMISNPDIRLATILGPGGMGKSRLATETGLAQINNFPNGVYFVELAPIVDPNNIPAAIANAVGYPFQEGQDQKQQILDYFNNKEILLILDNYEHLMEGAGLVSEILTAGPGVKVLATSREKLNLNGENVLTIGGMEMPDFDIPDNVVDFDAIQLFLQGASRSKANFKIEEDDLIYVSRICRMVGGMPLGILLATAWVDTLSLAEIAEEMQTSVDFLESESADTPDRHRSMRGVFEYSWKLLTEEERLAYMRMSIFYGGCSRPAAQAISGASIRTLTKLVNKSVLQRDVSTGRFQIHELLRQLGEEYLAASDEQENIRQQHSEFYLGLIAACEEDLKGKNQLGALDHMEADFENIRAAWLYAVSTGNEEYVNNALESLYLMTRYRSKFADGMELFEKARAKWPASSESDLSGRLLVHHINTNIPSIDTYRLGLKIAKKHGNPENINYASNQLGRVLAHVFAEEESAEGLPMLEESLAAYRKAGDDFSVARVLDDLGFAYSFTSQTKKLEYTEESVAIRRKINDQIGLSNVLLNFAMSLIMNGKSIEATNLNEEGLEIANQMNDSRSKAWHTTFLTHTNIFLGDIPAAKFHLNSISDIVEEINDNDLWIEYKLDHALILLLEEEYQKAKIVYEEVLEIPYESNMHMMGFISVGSTVALGLGDINKFNTEYIPQIHQYFSQIDENLFMYPILFPTVALALIKRGELRLAAIVVSKLEQIVATLSLDKVVDFQASIPMLKSSVARLKTEMGEEAYQAALAEYDSILMTEIVKSMM